MNLLFLSSSYFQLTVFFSFASSNCMCPQLQLAFEMDQDKDATFRKYKAMSAPELKAENAKLHVKNLVLW